MALARPNLPVSRQSKSEPPFAHQIAGRQLAEDLPSIGSDTGVAAPAAEFRAQFLTDARRESRQPASSR